MGKTCFSIVTNYFHLKGSLKLFVSLDPYCPTPTMFCTVYDGIFYSIFKNAKFEFPKIQVSLIYIILKDYKKCKM